MDNRELQWIDEQESNFLKNLLFFIKFKKGNYCKFLKVLNNSFILANRIPCVLKSMKMDFHLVFQQ